MCKISRVSFNNIQIKIYEISNYFPIFVEQSAPVEERYRAMKLKVKEVLSDRDALKLNTKETTDVIKNIRAKLNKEDLNEVKILTDEAVKEKPSGVKMAVGPWKITQRLKVICQYVLGKFNIPDQDDQEKTNESCEGDNTEIVYTRQYDTDTDMQSTATLISAPSTVESTNISVPTEPISVNMTEVQLSTSTMDMPLESSVQQTVELPVENIETQSNHVAPQSVQEDVNVSTNKETVTSSVQNVTAPSQPPVIQNVVLSQTQALDNVTQPQTQGVQNVIAPSQPEANQIVVTEPQPPDAQNVTTQSKPQAAQNVVTQPKPQARAPEVSQKKVEYPVLTHKIVKSKEGSSV